MRKLLYHRERKRDIEYRYSHQQIFLVKHRPVFLSDINSQGGGCAV